MLLAVFLIVDYRAQPVLEFSIDNNTQNLLPIKNGIIPTQLLQVTNLK
jgi:hypothetical protein